MTDCYPDPKKLKTTIFLHKNGCYRTFMIPALAALILMFSTLLLPGAAQAETEWKNKKPFSISAGELGDCLNALALQAKITLAFDPALTSGLKSKGLKGEYRVDNALALLLAGTNIVYRTMEKGAFILDTPEGTGVKDDGSILIDTITVRSAEDKAKSTSTGSKVDTPLLDLPASVWVITDAELKRRGVENLDQALSYTSSVSTDTYGSDDRYDFYYIRGFYETGTGTYRDGLPIRIYGYTGSRLEPYGMQRIEVMKGSTSTLYGLNSPGGLVNAITKRPKDYKFGEVYTTFGDEHLETGADFGGPVDADGHWNYRITTKWQDGDNGSEYTEDDRLYFAPALTWKPTDATTLTILADYNKHDGNTSHGIPYGSGIDSETYLGEPDFDNMDTIEKNIGYVFEHDFGNGLQLRQNARYAALDLIYESVYGASADPNVNRSAWAVYGDSSRFAVDNQLQYDTSLNRFNSRTLFGFDYYHDETHEHRISGSAPGMNIYNPTYIGRGNLTLSAGYAWNNEQTIKGIYLQEELTFNHRWILALGGRYDHIRTITRFPDSGLTYDASDEAVTTRTGLTYKHTSELSVYANYSESFQPISANRKSLVGDPKPKEGMQYEVGMKYQPANTNTLFTVALFDLTQTNTPYYVSATTQSQVGEVNVRGVELEAKIALTERLNLTPAYSYWDSKIVEDGIETNEGNRPQLVPQHLASIWTDYTIPGKGRFGDLTLGFGARFTGSIYADNDNELKIQARTLFDAGISYKVTDKATLSINATNLFDKEYISYVNTWSDTAYYGDSLTVKATLKYTW